MISKQLADFIDIQEFCLCKENTHRSEDKVISVFDVSVKKLRSNKCLKTRRHLRLFFKHFKNTKYFS